MTQNETRTFTVADPRQFDGDPFEVAERACAQAQAVARVLAACIQSAEIMARNAEMSRNLAETRDDARATEWDSSTQAQKFRAQAEAAEEAERVLGQLSRAAGFNPKAPLPKES